MLAIYGMTLTPDGEVVARLLGGQLLGYVGLELYALRGSAQTRVVNLRSIFVAELTGLAATAIAAFQGRGNALFWSVVAIFLIFTVWRGYYLLTHRGTRGLWRRSAPRGEGDRDEQRHELDEHR